MFRIAKFALKKLETALYRTV